MKVLVVLTTFFVVTLCNQNLENQKNLNLDFYVELSNFPNDLLDYTLSKLTEAYEQHNSDVLKIVPHVQQGLYERDDDKNWFVVANYDQTAFRFNLSLSVTETTHGDKYSIGNLLGCIKTS
nr:uncharacterized protein LOC111428406 [Onthophagus taurus]